MTEYESISSEALASEVLRGYRNWMGNNELIKVGGGWPRRAVCSCGWHGPRRSRKWRAMGDAVTHAHNAHPHTAAITWGSSDPD